MNDKAAKLLEDAFSLSPTEIGMLPKDLPLLLITLTVGLSLGLIIGLIGKYFFPHLRDRSSRWASSVKWRHYAGFAAYFLFMALGQGGIGQWSFAVLFVGLAAFELNAMVMALRRGSIASERPLTSH